MPTDQGVDETQALRAVSTTEQRYSVDSSSECPSNSFPNPLVRLGDSRCCPTGGLGSSSLVGWVGPDADNLCSVTNNFLHGFNRPQVAYGCLADTFSDKAKFPLFGTSAIKYGQLKIALELCCERWGWGTVVVMHTQYYNDLSLRFQSYFGRNGSNITMIPRPLGGNEPDRSDSNTDLNDDQEKSLTAMFKSEFENVKRQGHRIVCVLAGFYGPMVKGMFAARAYGRSWVVVSGFDIERDQKRPLSSDEMDVFKKGTGMLSVSPATPPTDSLFTKLLLQTIAMVARADLSSRAPAPVATTPPRAPVACTMAEVMKVGTAADKTSAVVGLMSSSPLCAQCLMGCASAADATGCGMACASGAPPVAPPPPAPEPASLAAACTMAEVMKVGTAADKTSAVVGLMSSSPLCAQCLMGCASAADATGCGMACASGGSALAATPPPQSTAALAKPSAQRTFTCTLDEAVVLADSLESTISPAANGHYPLEVDAMIQVISGLMVSLGSDCQMCLAGGLDPKLETFEKLKHVLGCMQFPYDRAVIEIPWLYDALLTMIIALNRTSASGADVKNGESVMRSIWESADSKIHFFGASGDVSYNKNFDNEANWAGYRLEYDDSTKVLTQRQVISFRLSSLTLMVHDKSVEGQLLQPFWGSFQDCVTEIATCVPKGCEEEAKKQAEGGKGLLPPCIPKDEGQDEIFIGVLLPVKFAKNSTMPGVAYRHPDLLRLFNATVEAFMADVNQLRAFTDSQKTVTCQILDDGGGAIEGGPLQALMTATDMTQKYKDSKTLAGFVGPTGNEACVWVAGLRMPLIGTRFESNCAPAQPQSRLKFGGQRTDAVVVAGFTCRSEELGVASSYPVRYFVLVLLSLTESLQSCCASRSPAPLWPFLPVD